MSAGAKRETEILSYRSNGSLGSAYEYVEGWGMAVGASSRVFLPRDVDEIRAAFAAARRDGVPLGLRGSGCSYGDASVNARGHVLEVRAMDRILAGDPATGIAECDDYLKQMKDCYASTPQAQQVADSTNALREKLKADIQAQGKDPIKTTCISQIEGLKKNPLCGKK